jgi:hypothetical protein
MVLRQGLDGQGVKAIEFEIGDIWVHSIQDTKLDGMVLPLGKPYHCKV